MFAKTINQLTKITNTLEDKLLLNGFNDEELVMIKHDCFLKHNYCGTELEIIGFITDYYSRISNVNKKLLGDYQ